MLFEKQSLVLSFQFDICPR